MGWHSIYDGLNDMPIEGNAYIEILDEQQLMSFNIKPCPFCEKTPLAICYENKANKIAFRLLCVQHQDKCKPELRTAPHDWLHTAVLGWNRRVEIVMSEQGKIKSSHNKDVQSFEDVSHKDFLNFLEEGNNG